MKTIYLRLTDKCNLFCKHCYSANKDIFMNLADRDITDFLNKADKAVVILHGGEPMLCDLKVLKEFVSRINHPVSITTNLCYKLTDENKEFILSLKGISTSWDPFRFTTNTQYELWLSNLAEINKHNNPMSVICTLTKEQLAIDPQEMADKIVSWGSPVVQFGRYSGTGDGSDKPTRAEVDEWFSKLKPLVKTECYVESCASSCMNTMFTINTDKTVAGCPNQYKIVYGKVTDEWQDIMGNKNRITQWAKEVYVKSKIGNYCFLQGECF